jgi:hypothetical protein
MPTISIGFEWPRGRDYEIVEPDLPRSERDPFAKTIDEPHIRQVGPNERERPARRPLEISPSLHLDFAKLRHSREDCLRFARSWGLLRTYAQPGAQEPLSRWFKEIDRMKASVGGLRRAFEEKVIPKPGFLITELDVILVPGKPDGRLALSLRPKVLVDAMRVQLAQSIAGGNEISVCEVCGSWFEKGGRGGDAKRSIARFCSDKCRNQFHNERRASK